MTESRRSFWTRAAWAGAAAGLFLVLTGDRGAFTATTGIDPLEILKLQIKPNVLIILDSSGSMQEPFTNTPEVGGDFAFSKMAKAKVALNKVLKSNQGSINFGFATYFSLNSDKKIITGAGSMRYVSDQPTAALWTGGNAAPDNTTDFFRAATTPYTGANGGDVFRSFGPFTAQLDENQAAACTVEPCQRFLDSELVRNNVKFTWDTTGTKPATAGDALLVSTTAIDCSLPANHAPLRMFPDDPDVNGDGLSDILRPCFQMQDSAGNVTTFWWSTENWNSSTSNCSGAALLSAVPACGTDTVPAILGKVEPQLPIDGTCTGTPVGIPCGTTAVTSTTAAPYTAAVVEGTNPAGPNANNWEGVIAAGNTPLGGSLSYVNTNFSTVFPAALPGGVQQNFVILVTDGIETCNGDPVTAACNLYAHNPRVYTFVIGLAINTGTLDQIARCGSGGSRDAIPAGNVDELEAALNSVLDTAVSTGAFSASASVVGTVFELVKDDPLTPEHESPYDPDTRYNQVVNILYQSTFGLPGWEGHLYAYQNDGTFLPVTNAFYTGNYDAGGTLFEQVSEVLQAQTRGTGRQPNRFTFFELHNGATPDTIRNENPAAGGALIRRRIFTSNGNGTFQRTGANDDQFDSSTVAGRNVVALWPPNQTGLSSGIAPIDPAVGTVGPLDDALGIGPGSGTVLTYVDLNKIGACLGSTDPDSGTIPPGCNPVADPVLALDTARKEARHILLAWIAGARLDKGTSDAKPRRAQDGSNDGELIFRDRGWILLDSTNAMPAVLGPPLLADPPRHVPEWVLMRDGRRNAAGLGINEIDQGFGLTNPDRDDPNPTGLTDLKPVMTVVYAAQNDGLHAFSAQTSEELWSFIPYDQLGKIFNMVWPGQARTPHIYMMATSIRIATVFFPDSTGFTLPSPSGTPVTYQGRWRRVLYLGRGPGGKFYTALDVTAPGQFTRAVLATNPPFVMWSRGNPDAADASGFYARMGQTWSVPAVGDVSGISDEFRVFTGSGYGDVPGEGTTFYQLNPATGDVIVAHDVGDGAGTYIPDNALVASPSGYNTFALDRPYALVRSSPNAVTRVYVPDLHGRIWKFNTTSGALFYDAGPTQPFANSPGLLKLDNVPYVFIESGNDNRITGDPTRPFKMFGIRDNGSDTPLAGDGNLLFTIDFPAPATSNVQFRGTMQPTGAYTSDGKSLVLFGGTRFNPPGADCMSSFDTIIFGVVPDTSGAGAGYAAGYDFNGDGTRDISQVVTGQRASNVSLVGGRVNMSMGGTLSSPPPANGGAKAGGTTGFFEGEMPTPKPPSTPPAVTTLKLSTNSPVCRF